MRRALTALLLLLPTPLLAQALQPTEGYLARFTRTVPRVQRAEVPLLVSFPEGSALDTAPVTFGVPFPRGALASERNLAFLENGQRRPASVRKTATWHSADGDVKWVLIDATVRRGASYTLAYGTAVQALVPAPGVRLEDTPEGVTVTSPRFRFSVSRTRPGLLESVALDGDGNGRFDPAETAISAGSNPPPSMTDAAGVVYSLSGSDEYRVTVEQDRLPVVISISGWYTSPDGRRLCQHLARLHYAGGTDLRLEHTFVIAFDTSTNRLRDIALPFRLTGEAGRSQFGLQDGARTLTGAARLIQDGADHYVLQDGSGAELASGGKAPGWTRLATARASLTVGLRRFWQEFPRELETREDTLIAHLWPAHGGRLLDFDARAVLGPERYREFDQVYWQDWYKGGLDKYDQAFGLAKTNDLLLAFGPPASPPAADLCRTLDDPVVVCATPRWMCASDVVGPILPRDDQRFPEDERRFALGLGRFQWLREHLADWGMLDYGDVHYNLDRNPDGTWRRHGWRCWGSRFYGHPVMPWVQFLRSGDRRFLDWAEDNTRHVMDIDMAHLTDETLKPYPRQAGGRHGGNSCILHYAADMYPLGCDSHLDQLLLQYYLTGYRRAWDVLQEEAGYYLREAAQPNAAVHRWQHRMTGGALRTMTDLYSATWDERYLALAREQAELCYQNQNADGVVRHDDVYMAPGFVRYYQATGDERMKELFLRCMRYQAKAGRDDSDPRSFGFYGLSLAYFLTGDASYLPWAERWRQDFHRCVQDSVDPAQRGMPAGQWDYSYLTLHLLYLPYYLQALATLPAPVKPVTLDQAVTNGDLLLHRESDKPFSLSAEWHLYNGRYCTGVAIGRLDAYLRRRPLRARLVVWDPQGREVAAAPLAPGLDAAGARLNPELPNASADARSGKVALTVPAGAPGVYRAGFADCDGLHLKLRLAACDLPRYGYDTASGYLALAEDYYFRAPAQGDTLTLGFKTLALRKQVQYTARDAEGKVVRQEQLDLTASPPGQYVTWTLPLPAQQRGRLWRLSVLPAQAAVEQTYLRLPGDAAVVWTNPEAAFPLAGALPPRPATPLPAEPYPGAGPCLSLAAGAPLLIPRGAARADGAYETLDPRQGTLEFWFRPQWAPDDVLDHPLVTCGGLALYRRSRLGTYVRFLTSTIQSGFVTEPGSWVHLAVTWEAGAPGREPKVRLFIDGVDLVGTVLSPLREPAGDWTADKLTIGGDAACAIDDLRVSRTVRYTASFTPPGRLQPDADTLLLRTGD